MSQMWECSCGCLVPFGRTCPCSDSEHSRALQGHPDGAGQDFGQSGGDGRCQVVPIDEPDAEIGV